MMAKHRKREQKGGREAEKLKKKKRLDVILRWKRVSTAIWVLGAVIRSRLSDEELFIKTGIIYNVAQLLDIRTTSTWLRCWMQVRLH